MKRIRFVTLITLFLVIVVNGIRAQTDKKGEDLTEALEAKDCIKATSLVKSIESVDYRDKDANSLLIYAVYFNCKDVINTLLEKKVGLDLQNTDGVTALFVASQEGNTDVVKLLLDNGAKLDLQKTDGATALFIASQDGLTDVVKILLDRGAKVNLTDSNGVTALIIASKNGHTEVVKLLLDNGADYDIQASNRATALMIASGLGHTEIVRLLLEKGANKEIKFTDGKTALDYAANSEIKNLLTTIEKDTLGNIQPSAANQPTAFMLPVFGSNYDCSRAQLLTMMRLPGPSNTMIVRLTAQEGATIIGDPAQMIGNIEGGTITVNGKIKIIPCVNTANEKDITIDGVELLFKLNGDNRLVYLSGKGVVTINGDRTEL